MTQLGFQSLVSSTTSGGASLDAIFKAIENLDARFVVGRVTSIIYDEHSPGFDETGGWDSYGVIKFELVDNQKPNGQSTGKAYPLMSSIKQIPVLDEIVFLIWLPSDTIDVKTDTYRYYYLPPISIWNHPHQNAIPNGVQDPQESDTNNKSISQIEVGSTNKSSNQEQEIDFNGNTGGTFVDNTIQPLLPFAGDTIFEGRFGNSIRLGNTSKTKSAYTNNWSEVGQNGDPITIIRNGQPEDSSDDGWIPTTENIEKDLSSLYLTSKQKIPLPTIESYEAFKTPPISTLDYSGNQAIISSGRIVFNSTVDSIILSSKKSLALSSEDTIGITSTGDFVVSAGKIKLGDPDSDHPIILGDKFLVQFANLIDGLSQIARELQVAQQYPGGSAVPWLSMNGKAFSFAASLEAIRNLIPENVKKSSLLSKVSNTS